MDLSTAASTGRLTDVVRARARAEAAEWWQLLAFRDAEVARIEALGSALDRVLERAAMVLSIGQAMGLSEAQVHSRLATAERVRERAPQTWLAFRDGRIDAARVRQIAGALDRLERPESWLRLDQSVIAYASTHTVAELRAWLRRFVVRVEEDLQLQRAEAARSERHVEVVHVEEAMAWVNAYVPSHVAAAIQKRLVREARAFSTDDPRTKPQRMADLLAAWCTTSESVDTSLVADIAVTIEADVLCGLKDGFAASSDGSWAVPALEVPVGRAEPAGRAEASSASRGVSARNERVPSSIGCSSTPSPATSSPMNTWAATHPIFSPRRSSSATASAAPPVAASQPSSAIRITENPGPPAPPPAPTSGPCAEDTTPSRATSS